MIAIDTNVLVRLLINDDMQQAAKAKQLFDANADEDGSVWISDTVLVEFVWVLARGYGLPRAALLTALSALAANATLALESAAAIQASISSFATGSADFADCLLAEKAKLMGCQSLFTFDRGMGGLAGHGAVAVLGDRAADAKRRCGENACRPEVETTQGRLRACRRSFSRARSLSTTTT